MTYIDWKRRRAFVEPADGGGVAKWSTGSAVSGLSFEMTRSMRDCLLGADPPVELTVRASTRLARMRTGVAVDSVHPVGTVITRLGADVRWWTWAGYRANCTLIATLSAVADPLQRPGDIYVRLRGDLTPPEWTEEFAKAADGMLVLPDVSPKAVRGLKFSAALPERLAIATLAARLADFEGARRALAETVRWSLS